MTTTAHGEGPPGVTIEGTVAVIRLNRPSVHNRMDIEDLAEFDRLLSALAAQPQLRVLLVTASGRSFCSGFNIGKLSAGVGDQGGDGMFERVADRLDALALPTICALNGGVYGGGTDLALACDFRIGVEGMDMFMPAAKLGLHFYAGGMRRYVHRLGLNAAKRLFLIGERQDTKALLRIGYLDEVVPADRLMGRAMELAAALAANAPLAVQGMKRCLNDIAAGQLDPAMIAANVARSRASIDLAEGRAAWLEKRAPHFIGA